MTVWIIIATLFAVVELASMAFVAMYLSLGAAAAAVVAGLDYSMEWQLLAFVLTGGVLLALTRPVLKRKLESPDVAMNVDRMTGKSGIVTIAIDNDENTGQIRVGTEYWTARWPEGQADRTAIPVDTRVRVVSVAGVTARVVPIEAAPIDADQPGA